MSKTPLWQAISNALREDMAEGRYTPGDKLPTEAELAERVGVNRHTHRHAPSASVEARGGGAGAWCAGARLEIVGGVQAMDGRADGRNV